MRIEIEYTAEEVDAILVKHHEAVFGKPPDGYSWNVDVLGRYSRTVKNAPVEVLKKQEVDTDGKC